MSARDKYGVKIVYLTRHIRSSRFYCESSS